MRSPASDFGGPIFAQPGEDRCQQQGPPFAGGGANDLFDFVRCRNVDANLQFAPPPNEANWKRVQRFIEALTD